MDTQEVQVVVFIAIVVATLIVIAIGCMKR
jgi:hypothetical protein